MKQFSITLTESEIEALQNCLCYTKLAYEQEANHLSEHNKTGINTKLIEKKRERANELEKIFNKLYDSSMENN